MTSGPEDLTTDPQNLIATLRAERDEALAQKAALSEALATRTAELVKRSSDFDERIEHQSVTIDVLKAMSASPGDPQPVFDLIARQASKLCNVPTAAVATLDGTMLHLATQSGFDPGYADAYVSRFPRPVGADSSMGRAILNRRVDQVEDIVADSGHSFANLLGHWSVMAVPMLRDGEPLGAITIGRPANGPFSSSQIALLQTFAEQAVIAITSAETYRALQNRTSDLQQSLEYQTATSEVLKVISRSTFDLQPVLCMVAQTAGRLCVADQAAIVRYEGGKLQLVANHGFPPEYEGRMIEMGPISLAPDSPTVSYRAINERRAIHIPDVAAIPGYPEESIKLGRQRTSLGVPLLREGEPVGLILLARQRVEPFTDQQIELVNTFADQAVIAIENTRLITEQREALEQQTATTEVLQVINASPGDLAPVFDTMLEKAMRLCGAASGALFIADGEIVPVVQSRNLPPAFRDYLEREPPSLRAASLLSRSMREQTALNVADLREARSFHDRISLAVAAVELGGIRSICWVPLVQDHKALGLFAIFRQEVRAFSEKQVTLVRNFAAQAVIAMENARLLNEVRQRQEELRVTFENMGDGVAMFDETPRLVAWNRKFQDILDLPDGVLAERLTFAEYIRYLAERGEYGAADQEEQIRRLTENADQYRAFERTRPDGRIIEVRHNPVPDGGFVLIYADITERKRSEAEIRAARDAAESAYRELKAAQANLIQAEKMASLGQLTAGIAHEIKNPLNFVNNFADLSADLLDELHDAVAGDRQGEIDELTTTLKGNLVKIAEHGRRADGIVRGMLEHSRGSSGERRNVDLNTLVEEALNLAYHGARAQDQSFNIRLERDFGARIAPIELTPQDMTRVLLNLLSNGFHATRKRERRASEPDFEPTLKVSTRDFGNAVEIRVWDNGTGIAPEVKDKVFQPFFTTKPTGEGTGLGLSITYEIVTKAHGGSITVDSEPGAFTEFTVRLPRQ